MKWKSNFDVFKSNFPSHILFSMNSSNLAIRFMMFDISTLFTVKYIKIEDSKTTPEKDVPYSVTVSALNSRNAAVELNNSVFDMIPRNFRFNDEFKVNGCDVGGGCRNSGDGGDGV